MAFKLKPRAQSGSLAPIKKFVNVGESVEGIYHGQRQGKAGYPPLLIIGETAIASKKQLTDDFATIPVGALERVTFKGKVNLAGGKTFNTFDVRWTSRRPRCRMRAMPAALSSVECRIMP